MNRFAITLLVAISSLVAVCGQDQHCLNCICQASTECNRETECDNGLCGPFLISKGYWEDGGSPGGNFEQCAKDKGCAREAVRRYMERYGRDCDDNGRNDCYDYARLHKMGNVGCTNNSVTGTAFWEGFQSCYGAGGGGGGGDNDDYDDEP